MQRDLLLDTDGRREPAPHGSTEPRTLRVAVGILHYRHWPEVRGTIDAVLAQTRPPDELFLFEHASGDGSADRIREAYPDLEVIEAAENRGSTAGANAVFKELFSRDADAVMLLTHGSRLAPDALEHLAARLEEAPEVGAVGPVLGYADAPERVFFGGGRVDPRTWHPLLRSEPKQMEDWRDLPPVESDWLDGGSILLRAEAGRQAGLFREEFYYHYDDNEYGMRLRSLGWRLECVPRAMGWSSPGRCSHYLDVRNQLGFVAWSAPRRKLARELSRNVYLVARGYVRPRDERERELVSSRLRGVIDFCRGRWGEPPADLRTGRHG